MEKQDISRLLVVILMVLMIQFSWAQKISRHIQLNQLGLYPNGSKVAVVMDGTSGSPFFITSSNLRDTVWKGYLSREKLSAHSSLRTCLADFSSFQKNGSYVLLVPGLGHSSVFEVGNQIMLSAGKATLKGFYFQRSAMPLEEKFADKWHRSAGNMDTAVFIHPSAADKNRLTNTKLSSSGGWYDAGDYNKYIVNSGITMGTLLSAYEDDPVYYQKLDIHIPESGNGVPDILSEVLYNLRWMLTMQDPKDGGVYHKCTHAAFDEMVMPGITHAPRWLVKKSTAAALNLAAVMAQSARVYKRFSKQLPGLSDSCLQAAKAAYNWAIANPSVVYDQDAINVTYTPAITTGAYGDGKFDDEFFWAATELYSCTLDQRYLSSMQRYLPTQPILPSWNQVGMMGYYTILRVFTKNQQPQMSNVYQQVKNQLLNEADSYVRHIDISPLHTPMGQSIKDFVWGSNSTAANQGILLLNAYRILGKKEYLQAAIDNADYLLGRNATGYCFITGLGARSPMHPHHRISVADGVTEPVPGLLVGGPNPARQDGCSYGNIETEMAYTDDDCSYASNEIAINWNAPAVYLFNAI
ncbi:MAG: cellulase, partial [Sediminibacterium sp.]|nr:cellulase [Sediminibacterium sp.]